MKRILIILAAGLFVMTAQSCTKKGENDPFLSFKTRDARITGIWELTSSRSVWEDETTGGGTFSSSKTEEIVEDGVRKTNDWVDGVPVNNTEENVTGELTINKDGTYSSVGTSQLTLVNGIFVATTQTTSTSDGYWWWLNDKKKKTRIAFDDDAGSMNIDRLKNKEMVITVAT